MDVSLVPQDERNIFYVFHGAQTVCQLFQENVDLKPGFSGRTRLMSAKSSDIINMPLNVVLGKNILRNDIINIIQKHKNVHVNLK